MNSLLSPLILCFVICNAVSRGGTLTVYINERNGTDSADCWKEESAAPCKDLQFALEVFGIHKENVTFKLAPGNYTLSNASDYLVLSSVQYIDFIGSSSDQKTFITCNNENAGLAFRLSRNISIEHVTVVKCGISQSVIQTITTINHTMDDSSSSSSAEIGKSPSTADNYRSALYFENTKNVRLSNVTLQASNGIGLAMNNSFGNIILRDSLFVANAVSDDSPTGGGGILIALDAMRNSSSYDISSCNFTGNNASVVSRYFDQQDHVKLGNGGGLAVMVKNHSKLSMLKIDSCLFVNNGAEFGGGISIEFTNSSSEGILIQINNSYFESNHVHSVYKALGVGEGGALYTSLINSEEKIDTTIHITECHFLYNYALTGGAISAVFSNIQNQYNAFRYIPLSLVNCTFFANRAKAGSAIYTSSWLDNMIGGYLPAAWLEDCTFNSNKNYLETTLNDTSGVGCVYSSSIPLIFYGETNFTRNEGSALVASGTEVLLSEFSSINFEGNYGHSGGGMALINNAWLALQEDTTLRFIDNVAVLQGGAIYSTQSGYQEQAYSCFIRYVTTPGFVYRFVDPSKWQTHFLFQNNTADGVPNAIHTPTLSPCLWPVSDTSSRLEDVEKAFCWSESWNYTDGNCSDLVTTSGAYFLWHGKNASEMMSVYPGKQIEIPLQFYTDKGRNATNVFTVQLNGNESFANQYASNGVITLYGKPGTVSSLILSTLAPRIFETKITVLFNWCPPGFEHSFDNQTKSYSCKCSNNYKKAVICRESEFRSYINWGFCITVDASNQSLVIPWVVNTRRPSEAISGYIQLPQRLEELNEFMCGMLGRTGFLCGECKENYSAPLYTYTYQCVECQADSVKYNWAYYVLLQFVPVSLLFLVILVFNISITSGPINAFIFFAQCISNPITITRFTGQLDYAFNDIDSSIITAIKAIFILPYSIWNLDFFSPIITPFCLAPRMKALHAYALNYILAFYPLFLIIITYVCIYLHGRNVRGLVYLWKPFNYCLRRVRRNWEIRASVADAFAAFLVLSYTKFCIITSYLLVPVWTFDSHGTKVGHYRLFFDPSVIYLGSEHVPYFILALLILIFIVILPPCLLLVYPTRRFQNLLSRFHIQGTGVRLFMESFHGCYNDGLYFGRSDCRYFAALYFFMRIITFGTIVLSYDLFTQRLLQVIFAGLFLLIFSLVKPYKEEFCNKVDPFILYILVSIVTIGFYNAVVPNSSVFLGVMLALFMITPLVYVVLYAARNLFHMVKLCYRSGRIEYHPRLTLSATGDFTSMSLEHSTDSLPDRLINADDYKSKAASLTCSEVRLDYGSINSSRSRSND